jgi:prephenate dehydrogenase
MTTAGASTPHPDGGTLSAVLVVGAGLIGASLGLALRRHGVQVYLHDTDPRAVAEASRFGAGLPGPPPGPVDLAVLAVPPAAVAEVLADSQRRGLAHAYTDTASVKAAPQRRAEHLGCDSATYVGGHPMAGAETSGPSAARGDLFDGRPWALTPTPRTSATTLRLTRSMVALCGAVPLVTTPDAHDAAVARASHTPQVLASLLAGLFADADDTTLAVAGQGLRDTVRVAASSPPLWVDILSANAGPVRGVLTELSEQLRRAVDALADVDTGSGAPPDTGTGAAVLADLLSRGQAGHARLPGKHGSRARLATVAVAVPDQPGRLATLLSDAARAGVNVEDLTIDHAPGQPVGLVALAVAPQAVDSLVEQLVARGWSARPGG